MTTFARQARIRTIFVMGLLGLLSLAVVVRVAYLQTVRHDALAKEAEKQLWVTVPLHAWRGRIYDRVGRPLALNEKSYFVWLDTRYFNGQKDPEAVAILADVANMLDRETRLKVLRGDTDGFGEQFFFPWASWVDPRKVERLQEMIADPKDPLSGVILEVEPRRTYPYGDLLGPVLGWLRYTNEPAADDLTPYDAQGGVEAYYDALLRGQDGWLRMERDPTSFMIPVGPYERVPPQEGMHLTLTLDLNIQYLAEKLLRQAIEREDARRGEIIVTDPRDGSILAMVSYPSFDPNDLDSCLEGHFPPGCDTVLWNNPFVGQQYEPGSTFKILTMAIALEEHVVSLDSSFECTGTTVVGDRTITNWNGLAHGWETMSEILLHSCNVGAVYVVQQVGPEAFYRYVRKLGFGEPTGVDMAGEISGTLRTPEAEDWALSDLATNAYGQSIAVTPLQLVTAVGAVANGGELFRPRILKAFGQGQAITETLPVYRGRVFHQGVTRDVTAMLVEIGAIKGEDNGPLIPGYDVAIKTGTAQIPGAGSYEPHRTVASAIGWAPAYAPRFLVLVRLEGSSVIWGESAAIPVWADMARFLLFYLQVPPSGGGGGGPP